MKSPEGKVALIDAGRGWLLGQLGLHEVDALELVIATHPHADHIGGMVDVLQSVPVHAFVDNGIPHPTSIYRQVMMAVERSGSEYRTASEETLELGSVRLEIMPPPPSPSSINNASVGVLLRYGSFTALFTGDAETEELGHFIDGGVPNVAVLKAAHHGARNGVSPRWLTATRPSVVVISVGADNGYGHPDEWALQYYKTVAKEIYRTDLHGEITVLGWVDGTYRVRTVRGERSARPIATDLEAPSASTGETASYIEIWVYPDAFGYDQFNLNGEYAVIRNKSPEALAIGGWKLCNVERSCYTFPPAATIAADDSVRVHTGIGQNVNHRFYMRHSQPMWHNESDRALLFNAEGRVIARYAY